MMNIVQCFTCGTPFKARRSDHRFCSDGCRYTWRTAMRQAERLRRTGESMIRAGDRLIERAEQLDRARTMGG